MSSLPATLQGLGDIIRFSRESSRTGQYEAALAYLTGAIAKISQYVLSAIKLLFRSRPLPA